MKILELRQIAQHEDDPTHMKLSWGFFHGYIDDLAVNSYHLPKLTGLYGVSTDGYFTYSSDQTEASKIVRPNQEEYMRTPMTMNH